MKRLSFLASIFGLAVARAQQCFVPIINGVCPVPVYPQYNTTGTQPIVTIPMWQERRPKNGQCPVCGTFAQAFKSEDVKSWMVRCNRCSNGFWQDAEVSK